MPSIAKPIRIAPAFDDPERIRSMFERNAPYRAIAAYVPDGAVDEIKQRETDQSVLPWLRGNWALGGEPVFEGAELILHNR